MKKNVPACFELILFTMQRVKGRAELIFVPSSDAFESIAWGDYLGYRQSLSGNGGSYEVFTKVLGNHKAHAIVLMYIVIRRTGDYLSS